MNFAIGLRDYTMNTRDSSQGGAGGLKTVIDLVLQGSSPTSIPSMPCQLYPFKLGGVSLHPSERM